MQARSLRSICAGIVLLPLRLPSSSTWSVRFEGQRGWLHSTGFMLCTWRPVACGTAGSVCVVLSSKLYEAEESICGIHCCRECSASQQLKHKCSLACCRRTSTRSTRRRTRSRPVWRRWTTQTKRPSPSRCVELRGAAIVYHQRCFALHLTLRQGNQLSSDMRRQMTIVMWW